MWYEHNCTFNGLDGTRCSMAPYVRYTPLREIKPTSPSRALPQPPPSPLCWPSFLSGPGMAFSRRHRNMWYEHNCTFNGLDGTRCSMAPDVRDTPLSEFKPNSPSRALPQLPPSPLCWPSFLSGPGMAFSRPFDTLNIILNMNMFVWFHTICVL
jgi:hypothetical protein